MQGSTLTIKLLYVIKSLCQNFDVCDICGCISVTRTSSNAAVLWESILGPSLFLLYINLVPDDFICNIAIYADDTTVCSKCDQASDLWQQLGLASEVESDLEDTMDWGRKWLVDFIAAKTTSLV